MNSIQGGCQTAKQESEIMIQINRIDRNLAMIQDRANGLTERIRQVLSLPQVAINSKAPDPPSDVRSENGAAVARF